MNRARYEVYSYYAVSFLFLIIGLFGINRLITKADLPFPYTANDNNIIATGHYGTINPGDVIYKLNGISVKSIFQLETILDQTSIGQDAELEVISAGNKVFSQHIHPVRYYNNIYFILVSLLVGLSFWITAVLIIRKKSGQRPVTVLFWILMLFSLTTMTSPGKYFTGKDWIAYLVRIFHVMSYVLGAVTFFYFTFIFPRTRIKNLRTFTFTLYLPSLLFCAVLAFIQVLSISDNASGTVFTMETLWKISELTLLILIISGLGNLYFYYRKIRDYREKKRTEWIFWGLAAGVSPFLLLWLVPELLGFRDIFPEEFLLAFLVLVPVFFTLAVVKYHVFEINVFIRKSILYSILTFITVIIYLSFISLISIFANDLLKEYSKLITILLILLIAFIINPLQIKLRNLIDRIFYKEKYNFENAVRIFIAGIKDQNTTSGLSKYIVNEIDKIIPVNRIALMVTDEKQNRLKILSHINFDELSGYLSTLRVKPLLAETNMMIGVKESAEPGIEMNYRMNEMLKKWGIQIIIPFATDSSFNSAAILLGEKKSGLRFTKTDIEILNVLVSNIKMAIEKIQLREKVIVEELEISRLEELNNMISYYVLSVSHDLKTPLTSIKMFTEMLKEQPGLGNANANDTLK